jgi:hypothetical protein
MKTLFSSFSLILIFLFFTAVAYLSTAGLETSKFNNLIEKEIQKKIQKYN